MIFAHAYCEAQGISAAKFVGVDEAGRGPLAGPVVAAAARFRIERFGTPFVLPPEFSLIKDSKKLTPAKREQAFQIVKEYFDIGMGMATEKEIDRENILQATFIAMKRALSQLSQKIGSFERVLVDGNQKIPELEIAQEPIVDGDGQIIEIAAASIMAKVARDRMAADWEAQYPAYGFAKHKGYGTKEHMEALRRNGPCPIHRMSFRPVELSIPENVNRRFASILKPRRG